LISTLYCYCHWLHHSSMILIKYSMIVIPFNCLDFFL
jgi:hypothetical protein